MPQALTVGAWEPQSAAVSERMTLSCRFCIEAKRVEKAIGFAKYIASGDLGKETIKRTQEGNGMSSR